MHSLGESAGPPPAWLWIVGVVATLLALVSPAPGFAATPYTLVIGDSLTYRGQDNLFTLRPDWLIDGVPQRRISTLPDILRDAIAAEGVPETLVIALGTNSNDLWTKQSFLDVLALLPPSTSVIFVTTYRDPNLYPLAADRMRRLSVWMKQIKAERPRTDVADWRAAAIHYPWLLEDGVHQTDPQGQEHWAALVSNAYRRLHPTALVAG